MCLPETTDAETRHQFVTKTMPFPALFEAV
jgi:hypothetical protein